MPYDNMVNGPIRSMGSKESKDIHNTIKRISPNSSNSTKRAFEEDPTTTFLPPSLSSYSIASLNVRNRSLGFSTASLSSTAATGAATASAIGATRIYEKDLPTSNSENTSIKDKIRAHFSGSNQSTLNTDFASMQTTLQHTRASIDEGENHSSPASNSLLNTSKADNSFLKIKRRRMFGKKLGSPKRATGDEVKPQEKMDLDKIPVMELEMPIDNNVKVESPSDPTIDELVIRRRVEERREKERLEKEKLEKERLEQQRQLEREKEEQQRAELVRMEQHRIELRRLELEEEARERARLYQLREKELFEQRKKEQQRSDMKLQPSEQMGQGNRFSNNKKDTFLPLKSPFKDKRMPLSDVSPNVFRKPRLPKAVVRHDTRQEAPHAQQRQQHLQQQQQSAHQEPRSQLEIQPLKDQHKYNAPPTNNTMEEEVNNNAAATTTTTTTASERKRTVQINGKYYEKLELLGRGGSSKVYRIKSVADGRQYALKKVTLNQFENMNSFKGEIDLLLKLRHSKRVVKLVDHAVFTSSIYLIMERGDIDLAILFQNRISAKLPLDIHFVKYHIHEMFKCVEDVHNAGIVHSDLKPANFLMVKGVLKIIDFGIANAVPDHTVNIYRESQIGTPNYMAPEALVEANLVGAKNTTWKVGRPSDVWSCGCILYQFIYGKPPYAAYSGTQRVMAIMNPQVKIQYPAMGMGDVKVPTSAIQLMKNCLARDPGDRWTIEQCLSSDFFCPKVVNETVVAKIVHESINFGFNKRVHGEGMSTDDYDAMVDDIIKQIEACNC
ncbi:protein kinase [Acetobacter pasteurianus]|nr:protein kinase [Acetobacter pasteurianus]